MVMKKTFLSGVIAGMFLVLGLCAAVGAADAAATRVGGTCAVEGQAVGTAAALCVSRGLTPRRLAETAIRDLQKTLLADGMLIPQMEH